MTVQEGKRRGTGPYIRGPLYDWLFFLSPPLLALGLGIAISGSRFSDQEFALAGADTTASALLIGTLIHAHLVAVFVRSHANPGVFRLYPLRFLLVPALLWLALVSSTWLSAVAVVVATFWDVWHSGAQTFGLARIYDRNAGCDPAQGRRLDLWLNQLLYAGPILAGATLADHLDSFSAFEDSAFFAAIPVQIAGHQRYLTWAVLIGGSLFVLCYLLCYARLYQRGYRVSPHKLFLVASTGLCSIYTWGFNSWGEAFFIMNLFHAVQYLALIWATEKRHLLARLRLPDSGAGRAVAAGLFLAAVLAYGLGAELLDPERHELWAVTIVVSLMHFWYDGFIWSVARRQV